MLFNSYGFVFLFLPVTLVVFYYFGNRGQTRAALLWLVTASLFFYAWWNPAYLLLLVVSLFFNYNIGKQLSRTRNKKLLTLGVVTNLFVLGYFKYTNFFIENINYAFDMGWNFENIFLPLAISFFTFQQIAYIVDSYRGETENYRFLHYCLFVSFFPQLIAGPIVQHKELIPQFVQKRNFKICYTNISVGLSIFILGLFKKVVIANYFGNYSDAAFNDLQQGGVLTFFEAWLGAFAYNFEIYFDFSAYSDMAIGLARMFGLRLPLNFDSPYKATSMIDYWRRWHMTLSRFLRVYLYFPLGGNRCGPIRRYVNLMLTMLIGGLWHGASWTFIIWGGLNGLYLIINHAWRLLKTKLGLKQHSNLFFTINAMTITFVAVVVSRVFFRADSFGSAKIMLAGMVGEYGVVWPEKYASQLGIFSETFSNLGLRFAQLDNFSGMKHLMGIVITLIFLWVTPNIHQIFFNHSSVIGKVTPGRLKWHANWKWGTLIGLLGLISVLNLGTAKEFIYFQF